MILIYYKMRFDSVADLACTLVAIATSCNHTHSSLSKQYGCSLERVFRSELQQHRCSRLLTRAWVNFMCKRVTRLIVRDLVVSPSGHKPDLAFVVEQLLR
jgi:hypothetical protein